MADDLKGPVDVLDMCCGGKKCPKIVKNSDGSLLISDEHAAPGVELVLSPEQAELLREFLG